MPGAIDQPFPGGDEGEGQHRRFAHGQVDGLAGEEPGIRHHIFGQRSRMAAHATRHAVNRLAGAKPGHAVTDGRDDARHVEAKDGGQRLARVPGGPGQDFRVERIDAAGDDANQHVARAWARRGNLYEHRPTRFLGQHRPHEVRDARQAHRPWRRRKARISAAISDACVSRAKWPVSSRWISASGRSRR